MNHRPSSAAITSLLQLVALTGGSILVLPVTLAWVETTNSAIGISGACSLKTSTCLSIFVRAVDGQGIVGMLSFQQEIITGALQLTAFITSLLTLFSFSIDTSSLIMTGLSSVFQSTAFGFSILYTFQSLTRLQTGIGGSGTDEIDVKSKFGLAMYCSLLAVVLAVIAFACSFRCWRIMVRSRKVGSLETDESTATFVDISRRSSRFLDPL